MIISNFYKIKSLTTELRITLKYFFVSGYTQDLVDLQNSINPKVETILLKLKYTIFKSKRSEIVDRILVILLNSIYLENALAILKKVDKNIIDNQENWELINTVRDINKDHIFRDKSIMHQKRIVSILARVKARYQLIKNYQFDTEIEILRLVKSINDYFSEFSKKSNLISKSLIVNYGNRNRVISYNSQDAEVRESGYVVIDNATIFDNSEVVLPNIGEPLLPMWGFVNSEYNISRLDSVLIDTGPDWVGLSIPANKHLKIYSAITLLSPMSSDFGHFVWDLICRLIVIEKNSTQLNKIKTVLLDSSTPDHFQNFITRLFPRFNFIRVEKQGIYDVEKLVVPLPNTLVCHDFLVGRNIGLGEHMDVDNLEWLLSRIENVKGIEKQTRHHKIYITRGQNPRWRKIHNERKLIKMLESQGFQIINPDEASMTEIMDSVAKSTTILLSAGSVIFNLFFAKPTTHVIILMSDGFIEEVGNSVTPYFFFCGHFLNFQVIRCSSSPGKKYLENFSAPTKIIKDVLEAVE